MINLVLDCCNDLGEGPVWDHWQQQLIWVDFDNAKICRWRPGSQEYSFIRTPSEVMVAIPTDHGNLIAGMKKEIAIIDPGSCQIIKKVFLEREFPYSRINDGKCDSRGRLWVSTMDSEARTGTGSLYKVNEDLSYEKMDTSFIIPNGLAWSDDNKIMFLIDSALRRVYQYEFDAETGSISNRKILASTPSGLGLPDGMSIDTEGNLWIAFWKGACIGCVDSVSGELLKRIKTPFGVPTSCCFGGQNLDILFITSSRKYDSAENVRKFEYAGGLFSSVFGSKGFEANFFREQ